MEDIENYQAFEAAIIANYDARTALERELVLGLESLLWRMRRATAIETDLLQIQAEILSDRWDEHGTADGPAQNERASFIVFSGEHSVQAYADTREVRVMLTAATPSTIDVIRLQLPARIQVAYRET